MLLGQVESILQVVVGIGLLQLVKVNEIRPVDVVVQYKQSNKQNTFSSKSSPKKELHHSPLKLSNAELKQSLTFFA